jgi:hypothetical protein
LKVGHLVDGRWKLEAVDQVFKGSGWAEYVTALAFDRHGFLHVSYEDGGALKHAYWDGERWHVQLLVGSTGEPAIYSAMKIAGDNTIYISYHDAVGNALRVAVGHPVAAESAAAKPSEASANVRDKVN